MSQHNEKFGTTVNCMDGRALSTTNDWMKRKYDLDYIDAITEPGIDAFVLKMSDDSRAWLKRKLEISIKNHGSRTVSVVGHDDCAGNPVSAEEHAENIKQSVALVRMLISEIDPELAVSVVGLWAHATDDPKVWTVDEV